jgi:CrcB protein
MFHIRFCPFARTARSEPEKGRKVQPADAEPAATPVDPDIDLHVAGQRRELATHPGVLAAIAVGGALGSAARYGVGQLLPHDAAQGIPWATLVINTVGSLLIGVLIVVITEVRTTHWAIRPFVGVGVLGGFTTFSAYTDEVRTLLARGAAAAGLGYLALTVVTALAGVAAGVAVTRLAARGRTARGRAAR